MTLVDKIKIAERNAGEQSVMDNLKKLGFDDLIKPFQAERKWFEKWIVKHFTIDKNSLKRHGDAYADDAINIIFISFCAGWQFNDLN